MAGELTLSATLHRSAYHTMPTPQQAYLLLEAIPSAPMLTAEAQSVNFSLVLDRSGSMAGEKLYHMKEAAKRVVEKLGATDALSVIVFDDTADIIQPTAPVLDPGSIKQRIDLIDERGGTHMSSGMEAGLQELQNGQAANRVNRMLLLTDGQTWEDQHRCAELADQCRLMGIPIEVLGFGVDEESNWDPRFLEDLAERSGGEWTVIDKPDKVVGVFQDTLASMQGTAVSNATLTMRLVQGVSPRTVWRVTPMISRLGQREVSQHDVQVFLGDIQYSVGQSILSELLIPARKPGSYRLMQADITYDVPSSGLEGQRVSLDVVVPYTPEATQAEKTDARLMNIIERVVAHKLQTQALDEAAMGDLSKATRRLRAAATRLLELGETELSAEANRQADQMEQSGRIDPEAAKRMRYETKKLSDID